MHSKVLTLILISVVVGGDVHGGGGGGGGDFRFQPIWVIIATSECHCMKVGIAYLLDII